MFMDIVDVGPSKTATERANSRRYQVEIIAGGVVYAALVLLSTANVDHVAGPAKFVVAASPALGAIAMAVAFVRYAIRLDELQRQTIVNAAAIALLVTICTTMALGFLENAGLPHFNMTWVWPIAVISWAIALPFVRRRYR